jgi:hypothetical protein
MPNSLFSSSRPIGPCLTILLFSALASGDAEPPSTTFADPRASEVRALSAAISLARKEGRPSAQWLLGVAGDARQSETRRRRAAVLFFHHYASEGTPLNSFAAPPGGREWLPRRNLMVIKGGGVVPVKTEPGTVFKIFLSVAKDEYSAIYLRVEGDIDEAQLYAAITGDKKVAVPKASILETGFSLHDADDRRIVAPDDLR